MQLAGFMWLFVLWEQELCRAPCAQCAHAASSPSQACSVRCLLRCVQENVLAESAMMLPETRQRLETAFNDLQSYLVRCGRDSCDLSLGTLCPVYVRPVQVPAALIGP